MRRYREHGVDFLSVIKGGLDSDARLADAIPSMGTPSAPFLDFAGEVRRALDVPVMHAAAHRRRRHRPPRHPRGPARPGRDDPRRSWPTRTWWPRSPAARRTGSGRASAPSYCLDAIYESGDAKCIHNPATGREQTLPHVVGPAPSGAASAPSSSAPAPPGSRRRGCSASAATTSSLMEAADRPGGQVLLAASGRGAAT